MTLYKCNNCYLGYINADDLHAERDERGDIRRRCPECDMDVEQHCERDRPCHCAKTVHETIAYCEVCGAAVCPECGCHDVEQISRITGYLNAVSGFNAAKAQELKDRVRYDIGTDDTRSKHLS